jgi:predicted nucleic acid-binding protein
MLQPGASRVLATALGDDGEDGELARERLRGEELAAPEIIDLEVTSVWRRTLSDDCRGSLALADLADLPISRAPHPPFLARCWELRHNLTTYDAVYVALAETLDVLLLTADQRMAGASGVRCALETLP